MKILIYISFLLIPPFLISCEVACDHKTEESLTEFTDSQNLSLTIENINPEADLTGNESEISLEISHHWFKEQFDHRQSWYEQQEGYNSSAYTCDSVTISWNHEEVPIEITAHINRTKGSVCIEIVNQKELIAKSSSYILCEENEGRGLLFLDVSYSNNEDIVGRIQGELEFVIHEMTIEYKKRDCKGDCSARWCEAKTPPPIFDDLIITTNTNYTTAPMEKISRNFLCSEPII